MKIALLSDLNITVHNVFSIKIQPIPYASKYLLSCKMYGDEDDVILTLKYI